MLAFVVGSPLMVNVGFVSIFDTFSLPDGTRVIETSQGSLGAFSLPKTALGRLAVVAALLVLRPSYYITHECHAVGIYCLPLELDVWVSCR